MSTSIIFSQKSNDNDERNKQFYESALFYNATTKRNCEMIIELKQSKTDIMYMNENKHYKLSFDPAECKVKKEEYQDKIIIQESKFLDYKKEKIPQQKWEEYLCESLKLIPDKNNKLNKIRIFNHKRNFYGKILKYNPSEVNQETNKTKPAYLQCIDTNGEIFYSKYFPESYDNKISNKNRSSYLATITEGM